MLKACGINDFSQLNEKSNNRLSYGDPIISPPLIIDIDASQISSLSCYCPFSVMITKGGEIQAIGNNTDGSISRSLPKEILHHFSKYTIRDNEGRKCIPISAYACSSFTLYLVSIEGIDGTYLALASPEITSKYPIILKTKSSNLLGLFGGAVYYAAAIDSEGSIYIVDVASIKNQQSGIIEPTRLPNGEKAVSVAFCLGYIIVLAESSNIFISQVTYTKDFQFEKINEFKIVSELKGKKIKQISGVSGNCLAVSEDGKVFGYGNNKSLSLGLNRRGHIQSYNEFTEQI